MKSRPSAAALALLALVLAVTTAGCPCVGGVVNASPGLRWFLFSNFGASRICPEMMKTGVPLQLQERSPAIGRFFPAQCSHDVDDSRKTVAVHIAGTGYAYIQPARRVGFSLTTSVEYRPDFQIASDDVYVWGRLNRIVQGPDFKIGHVENPLVDVMAHVPPMGSIANLLGQQIVSGELMRGFTVVHNEDRGNEFALGILMPPNRPHRPFDVSDTKRFTFANETIEVAVNQRDYLGPFEIPSGGKSLVMMLSLVGPAVDLMIVDRRTGDLWRDAYQTGQPLGPPPGPVMAGSPLQPGATQHRRFQLPAGSYYVVIDNTPAAGLVAPPVVFSPFGGGPVARVSYVAQLGE